MKHFFMMVTILFILSGSALYGHAELQIVSENGRQGIVNSKTGEYVIKPTYDSITADGHFYIVTLDHVEQHSEDVLGWVKGARTGKKVGEGRWATRVSKRGVINENGDIVIPVQYGSIQSSPVESVFIVGECSKCGEHDQSVRYGLIDNYNNILVRIEYEEVKNIRRGLKNTLLVTVRRRNQEEELELNLGGDDAGTNTHASQKIGRFKEGNMYGFRIDGKVLVHPAYEDAWDFKNGYARVKKDGKWGYIDEKGNLLFSPCYNYCWDFNEGKAKVRLDDGSIRYIDTSGKGTEN